MSCPPNPAANSGEFARGNRVAELKSPQRHPRKPSRIHPKEYVVPWIESAGLDPLCPEGGIEANCLAASRLSDSFPVIESDAELVDIFAWRNNSKDKRSPLKRSTKCNLPMTPTRNKRAHTTTTALSKTGHLPDRLGDNGHSAVHDHTGLLSRNKMPQTKHDTGIDEKKVWVVINEDEDVDLSTYPSRNSEPQDVAGQIAEACAYLKDLLLDPKKHENLFSYGEETAQRLLDVLQMLLNHPQVAKQSQKLFLAASLRLSWATNLYPSPLNLLEVTRESKYPVTDGHSGEIYKGSFRGSVVCIKYCRINKASQTALFHKTFSREAIIWSQLSHANILPFSGVHRFGDKLDRIGLVSPWMKNGHITRFLKEKPSSDRLSLVSDIVAGLLYLHTNNVVHGDLAPTNVLVNDQEGACIAGFDLSCIMEADGLPASDTPLADGTTRFQAPELIDPDCESSRSTASDVYAFGMLCYHIFTGHIPFSDVKHDFTVLMKILQGEHPQRPSDPVYSVRGLTDGVWKTMQDCWQRKPENRPSISQIAKQLLRRDEAQHSGWEDLSPSRFTGSNCTEVSDDCASLTSELLRLLHPPASKS